jgi:23S rRNA G2445 N2-methylase RlmL/tetratricopeptide (TPR) repeat protein
VAESSIAQRGGAWHFEGELERVADKLPETVRQVIEMQVDRLPAGEQRILEAASVVGAEFSAASVAAALDLPQAEIEEACDSLVERQQLLSSSGVGTFPIGTVSARYAFRHALHSSALYHRVPPSRRARWHLRIARRGEELFGARAGEIAGELAVHFEEGHDAPGAVKHRLLAARTDARRHANREAVEHLVRAGALLERIAEPQRSELRLVLLEELGVTRRSMGDMQGSSEAFEELAGAAAGVGQRSLRIRALLYLASTLFWVDRDRCLAVVDKTLESSRELDDELLVAHVRGYCGHWSLNLRGFDAEHARAGELAVAAARRADDRALLALHVVRHAYTQIVRGRHREAIETTREGCELALQVGDAFDFLLCRFFRGWALLHAGEWGELRSMLADSIELAERNGHSLWSALLRLESSQLHERRTTTRLLRVGGASAGAGARLGRTDGQILFHGSIALARARVGERRDAEAERCFREIEERLRKRGAWMDWMLYFPLLEARSRWRVQRDELERAQVDAVELLRRATQSGEPIYATRAHVGAGGGSRCCEAMPRAPSASSTSPRRSSSARSPSLRPTSWRARAGNARARGRATRRVPNAKRCASPNARSAASSRPIRCSAAGWSASSSACERNQPSRARPCGRIDSARMARSRDSFFVTCAPGLEPVLHEEAKALELARIERQVGGVYFEGALQDAWRANLWLRTAVRVLMRVARFPAANSDELYAGARSVEWSRFLRADGTLVVDAHSNESALDHTLFVAQRVKDAVVDSLRAEHGTRPTVAKDGADLGVYVHLFRDRCTLLVDTSGESLHKRGWRQVQGRAPLAETLAAGIVLSSQWDRRSPLIDPFCGSGTILIEAALIAAGVAPGLFREGFGFERWPGHDRSAWLDVRERARTRSAFPSKLTLLGRDLDAKALEGARENAAAAGFDGKLQLEVGDALELAPRKGWNAWIVSNLPYGERVSSDRGVAELHRRFGTLLRERCAGFRFALFTSKEHARSLGLGSARRTQLSNGGLECELLTGEIA